MVSAVKGRREMGRGARVGDAILSTTAGEASLIGGELYRQPHC